ncbi:MAG TPA: cytochrome c, partial [Rhizomicrobium sp.]|nr:cytochrome c [Rhizomicrobium sp.]
MAAAILAATAGGAAADGAAVFDNSCAFCHQSGGVGVAGQFPRLAGRVGAIAAKPEGKKFLPQILLNGMSGRITVDGEPILGIMPAFNTLSDEDIAAVLSYLTGLDHAAVPFTADEIKAIRAEPAPADMMAERARLTAA